MVVLELVSLGLVEKVVELGGMLLALGAGPAGMFFSSCLVDWLV